MQRRSFLKLLPAAPAIAGTLTAQDAPAQIRSLRVRVLSTMLADAGIGEWGFAAYIEADGRRFLFDTGGRPETVRQNAAELKVDLAQVDQMLLSHFHGDHNAGLLTLRREAAKQRASALGTCYVGEGIFLPRRRSQLDERESNDALLIKPQYEALGGKFVTVAKPTPIFPGAWLTGPVPRPYPERNWSGTGQMKTAQGWVEDNLPEDMSLAFDTAAGWVVVSGCGHSGIINTLEHIRKSIRTAPIHAAIGGFHLFPASDATLDWTGGKLKEFGLENLLGAHCTGIEAVYHLRQQLGLKRANCVVGAVGASFTLGSGISPGQVAR